MSNDTKWSCRDDVYETAIAEGFHNRDKHRALGSLRTGKDMSDEELQALANQYGVPYDDGERRFEPNGK